MAEKALFEWRGREHDYNPKSADWYWALGIVAVSGVIAAILFGSYLVATLILVAAVALALHAAKEPSLHHFRLVERGIFVGEEFHPFEEMTSFSVLEDIEGKFPPVLSVKTTHWFFPHLVIPLEGVDVDLVYAYFLHHVNEEEHHHTLSDVLAAWLRL